MAKIKKSTTKSKKAQNTIKEYELRSSVTSIVDHIKNEVRNVIIEASNKDIITSLHDREIEILCNLIDSTIGSAYTQAASVELSNLYRRILQNK